MLKFLLHSVIFYFFFFTVQLTAQENIKTFQDVNFPIGEIIIDSNGDILIVGEGGVPIVELTGGEDYVITDSNGQVRAIMFLIV